MSPALKRVLASAALVACLAAASPVSAAAVAPEIKDEGKFFSDQARAEADRKIKEIHREFHKDLLIETFAQAPPDLVKDVDLKDRTARNRFFEKWARERAKDADVNGIYVLVCRSPEHLQVEVGDQTQKKDFTQQDRQELVKLLVEKFREKKYDEGLLDAVNFVGQRLKAHGARSGVAVPRGVQHGEGGNMLLGGIGGLICLGLLVVGGLWLIIGLFRAISGAGGGYRGGYGPGGYGPGPGGPAYGAYGGGYGGRGGGFMSSLLGGMFGAAAGNWMYNSFFGGGGHTWGGGPGGGYGTAGYGGTPDAGAQQPDTDYSGGGGDFGPDDGGGGGGGDFGGGDAGGGGGDFGGGDAGGGDFGGGGGDFGGGGGDFGGGGGDF